MPEAESPRPIFTPGLDTSDPSLTKEKREARESYNRTIGAADSMAVDTAAQIFGPGNLRKEREGLVDRLRRVLSRKKLI